MSKDKNWKRKRKTRVVNNVENISCRRGNGNMFEILTIVVTFFFFLPSFTTINIEDEINLTIFGYTVLMA